MTAQAATQCVRPGCGGTITEGFCDVCGMAPARAASVPPPVPVPAEAGEAPGSRESNHDPFGLPSPQPGGTSAGGTSSGGSYPGGASSGGTSSGGRGTRSGRSARGRSRRGLGGGLVDVPAIPASDPASAVQDNPEVPERKRFCGNCGQPVGRSSGGRPGRAEGFCRNCGTRFSFTPKLRPGELVAGQYEVLGCLAHGGLGWVYLARDRRVSDMWVVLKGLLNTGDADAAANVLVERDALAEVRHPNIVQIHNFVSSYSPVDGETTEYIVMDYVGGKSLKDIRLEARARGGAVPLAHALAYMIEILPAFGYLHDRGLVYCDFKPDNVIQTEEQLQLIDLGGVRAIEGDAPIYGTVGFQAPEVEADGPSPGSDLYTVGRTLAVLTFDFNGYSGEYKYRLPDSVPLLNEQESFARALRKATHADPHQRFQTAGEMAEQLTGVLREVLAAGDGKPRPAFSSVFTPELHAIGVDLSLRSNGSLRPGSADGPVMASPQAAEVISGLPVPLVDGADPAAGYLATLGSLEPGEQVETLRSAVKGEGGVSADVASSAETRFALARALIMAGQYGPAQPAQPAQPSPPGSQGDVAGLLASLAADEPGDWRIAWYNGLLALAQGNAAGARAAFSAVFDALPGELAPKLALGFAAEAAGDAIAAQHYFQIVWLVDRSYISAAFGLARACMAAGHRSAAVASLAAVPETSSQYASAQIAAVRLLVSGGDGISPDDLRQADGRLRRLHLDDVRREQLTIEVLGAALTWVTSAAAGAAALAAPPGAAAPGPAGLTRGPVPGHPAGSDGPSQPGDLSQPGGLSYPGHPASRGHSSHSGHFSHPGHQARPVGHSGPAAVPYDLRILGCEPNERALRLGLERGYRMLARLTPDPVRKVELVDMANEIRPRTWT